MIIAKRNFLKDIFEILYVAHEENGGLSYDVFYHSATKYVELIGVKGLESKILSWQIAVNLIYFLNKKQILLDLSFNENQMINAQQHLDRYLCDELSIIPEELQQYVTPWLGEFILSPVGVKLMAGYKEDKECDWFTIENLDSCIKDQFLPINIDLLQYKNIKLHKKWLDFRKIKYKYDNNYYFHKKDAYHFLESCLADNIGVIMAFTKVLDSNILIAMKDFSIPKYFEVLQSEDFIKYSIDYFTDLISYYDDSAYFSFCLVS